MADEIRENIPASPVDGEENIKPQKAKRKSRFSVKEAVWSVCLIAVVFFVFHVLLGFVPVKGASMQPLINSNNEECTSIVCRLAGPKRGSVVVFPRPAGEDVNLIKRVIAVEGDEVKIQPKANDTTYAEIYLNGELLDEPYLDEEMNWSLWIYADLSLSYPSLLWHSYGVKTSSAEYISFTVPEGKFFALGDNRNDSRDSRHYGFFDADETVGRVFLIIDSDGLRFI